MKIQIKNLGALKQAEFSLGDLTIICGGNNTGKTYATYALYGFLSLWREVFSIRVHNHEIDQLLADGAVYIDVKQYLQSAAEILSEGCQAYTSQFPMVFAAPDDRFKDTEFKVDLAPQDFSLNAKYKKQRISSSTNVELFSITKSEESTELVVTLLVEKGKVKIPRNIIEDFISDALKEIIFGHLLPNPFIASAERTGAAIFRNELNFARNRLLEEVMNQAEENVDFIEHMFKAHHDYALPVANNVDFTRQLETIFKKESFIAKQHPVVLDDFVDIIGGKYTINRDDKLSYVPKGKRIKLSMDESSSAVRSLLDIGFYLHHVAQPGDLLMVDEPELNLHPENQRRVARLFARLINLGIKVFITTHSDYIIKELNTLIMLNHDQPHLKRIADQEGYQAEELLAADQVKVYIAELAPVLPDGNKRKNRYQTLTVADIDPALGIEARSFDTTIETMNRIQEEIVWGED